MGTKHFKVEPYNNGIANVRGKWLLKDRETGEVLHGSFGGIFPTRLDAMTEAFNRERLYSI